jgi:flagellar motor switch protein FliM
MSSRLDQSEVDALMQAIQDGRVAPEPGAPASDAVITYDLTSQDRIIRGQMPTLDSIDDRTASLWGGALAARTRLDIRVQSSPATLLKFADVTNLMSPPAIIGLMALGPGHGLAVMITDSLLARSLVAGALGDRKARVDSADAGGKLDLTNVERLVLKHLLAMLCDSMAQAWADVLALKPEVVRFESDPRMVVVASPSDLAILCSFELSGAATGKVQVAIPYATVEPVKKLLASPIRHSGNVDVRFSAALARELEHVGGELRAEIGKTKLSFSRLLELKVGDLVTLDGSEAAPLPIYVQGRRKMTGVPRVMGGSLAVVIDKALVTGRAAAAPSVHKPESRDGKVTA